MPTRFVSREDLERLRTAELRLPDWIDAPRLATLGELVSWAVWADEAGRNPLRAAADPSPLTPDRLDGVAHVDAVIVSANSVVRPSRVEDWSCDHTGRRDFVLARAIRASDVARERLWGAYMTSFIKGRALSSTIDLGTELRRMDADERGRLFAVMGAQLEHELDMLGADDPVLLCVGDDAYAYVSETFGDRYRLAKMPPWSTSQSEARYASQLHTAASRAFG